MSSLEEYVIIVKCRTKSDNIKRYSLYVYDTYVMSTYNYAKRSNPHKGFSKFAFNLSTLRFLYFLFFFVTPLLYPLWE